MKRTLMMVGACLISFGTYSVQASESCLPLKKLGLCAFVELGSTPKVSATDVPFVVSFTKDLGASIKDGDLIAPDALLKVELFMPSMGHGSSPVTVTLFPKTGIYFVNKVKFLMAGPWEIRIKLLDTKTPTLVLDEVSYDVKAVP